MRNIRTSINTLLAKYNVLFDIVSESHNEYTGESIITTIKENLPALKYNIDKDDVSNELVNISLDTIVLLAKKDSDINKQNKIQIDGNLYRIENIEQKDIFQAVIIYANKI